MKQCACVYAEYLHHHACYIMPNISHSLIQHIIVIQQLSVIHSTPLAIDPTFIDYLLCAAYNQTLPATSLIHYLLYSVV